MKNGFLEHVDFLYPTNYCFCLKQSVGWELFLILSVAAAIYGNKDGINNRKVNKCRCTMLLQILLEAVLVQWASEATLLRKLALPSLDLLLGKGAKSGNNILYVCQCNICSDGTFPLNGFCSFNNYGYNPSQAFMSTEALFKMTSHSWLVTTL